MKYVHQTSVCKPHTISQSQARNLHDINKPSILPEEFYIRQSEKRVKDGVYWTMTFLSDHGFSYREIRLPFKLFQRIGQRSLRYSSNKMEDESEFDADTLPTCENMRKMLKKKIEAYSLKQVVEHVLDAKSGVCTFNTCY